MIETSSHSQLFLATLCLGARKAHGSLSVWPLLGAPAGLPTGFMLADEARANGSFALREVSESGSVPVLRVANSGDLPIFLLDGEAFVGAKQNRAINLSLLVPSHDEIEIPVSCVEQGRWHHEDREFAPAQHTEFMGLRAMRMASVSDSFRQSRGATSDQSAVWERIARKSARMGSRSRTGAMAELYASRSEDLARYEAALAMPAEACGAVYVIGGQPAGREGCDRPAVFAALARRLLAGYALDAREIPAPPLPDDSEIAFHPDARACRDAAMAAEAAAVEYFLASVRRLEAEAYDAPGLGRNLRLTGRANFGATLEHEGRCIHLAAFARQVLEAA